MRRTHLTKMDCLNFGIAMLVVSFIAATLSLIGNVMATHREMMDQNRKQQDETTK